MTRSGRRQASGRGVAADLRLRLCAGLVLGLAAIPLTLGGCGGSSSPNQEEIAQFKKQGAEHVHKEVRLRRLERELRHIKHGGTSSGGAPAEGSPGTSTSAPSRGSCGGELEVNSATTCPFAENVENAYYAEISSGSGNVEAWSPVTERNYVMYCTASPHECTGGNNAVVYFP
jgi:hypothetical protein